MKLSKADLLKDRQYSGMSASAMETAADQSAEAKDAIAADAELMRRASNGDTAAWRHVVELNLPNIHGLAYRMSLTGEQAEDISQEAFLRLWRIAPRWKPEARISTWLYRVVRNLAIDAIRKRRSEAAEELDEDLVSDTPTPLEILNTERTRARIGEAVRLLPERQRLAITLVHFGECSGSEAAGILDISIEALESLLARGRRGLKKILMEQE